MAWFNVRKGDVVAVMSGNSVKNILVQYSCAKIGSIFSPLNAYYKEEEIASCLRKIKPKMLFIPGAGSAQESSINRFYDLIMRLSGKTPKELEYLVILDGLTDELPNLEGVKSITFDELSRLIDLESKENVQVPSIPYFEKPKSSDPASLHFTSVCLQIILLLSECPSISRVRLVHLKQRFCHTQTS